MRELKPKRAKWVNWSAPASQLVAQHNSQHTPFPVLPATSLPLTFLKSFPGTGNCLSIGILTQEGCGHKGMSCPVITLHRKPPSLPEALFSWKVVCRSNAYFAIPVSQPPIVSQSGLWRESIPRLSLCWLCVLCITTCIWTLYTFTVHIQSWDIMCVYMHVCIFYIHIFCHF